MTALYAKDGVLWGTLSPTVRSDPGAVKAYFVAAFQALPKATVKFGDQLIRVYGDTAVNTGYYTFSDVRDGQAVSRPARFTMVFRNETDSGASSVIIHPKCRSSRVLNPTIVVYRPVPAVGK